MTASGTDSKPPAQDELAARTGAMLSLSVREGMLWSVMFGFGELYMAPFALFLGSGNLVLAALATFPTFLGALAQILFARLIERRARAGERGVRRGHLAVMAAAQAATLVGFYALARLYPGMAVPSILFFGAMYVVTGQGLVPAWTSLMGDLVPESTRGAYFGRRARWVVFAMCGATLLAGGIAHGFEQAGRAWTGFALLFAVAASARLLSARLLHLHDDPPYVPSEETLFSFWAFVRATPRSNFMKFTFFMAGMLFSMSVASPFFNVYMLRELKFSYTQFTACTAMVFVTQFLFAPWWGRMGDRHGNRSVIAASSALMPVLPVLWALARDFGSVLVVQFLAGVAWSGLNLGSMNYIYDAVSREKRPRVVAYYNVVVGFFVFAGGTIAGGYLSEILPSTLTVGPWTVTFLSSLPLVFLVSALLRGLVATTLVPLFKEVKDVDAVPPHVLLVRLTGLPAVLGLGDTPGDERDPGPA